MRARLRVCATQSFFHFTVAPAPEIVPCPTTNTKVSTAPFRVFRYHFFIVKADPPRPLTFLAEAQTKDCCYLLRRCHIDADFYPAFQCEDRSTDYTSLFRGTGTLVLRLPRPPTALSVRAGEDVLVAPESLLGWTGRLFPLDEPPGATHGDATLALRGDGTALLV